MPAPPTISTFPPPVPAQVTAAASLREERAMSASEPWVMTGLSHSRGSGLTITQMQTADSERRQHQARSLAESVRAKNPPKPVTVQVAKAKPLPSSGSSSSRPSKPSPPKAPARPARPAPTSKADPELRRPEGFVNRLDQFIRDAEAASGNDREVSAVMRF